MIPQLLQNESCALHEVSDRGFLSFLITFPLLLFFFPIVLLFVPYACPLSPCFSVSFFLAHFCSFFYFFFFTLNHMTQLSSGILIQVIRDKVLPLLST